MRCSLILSILVLCVVFGSIDALPLTDSTNEKPGQSKLTTLPKDSNEREGRAWSPFGEATAARRGRFNRDVSQSDSSLASVVVGQPEQEKPNSRQKRAWSPFGEATASRRGRGDN